MPKSNNERYGSISNYLTSMSIIQDDGPLTNGVPCCEWIGRFTEKGYAVGNWDCRGWRINRFIWINEHGEIPDGLFVCHTCDNRKCIEIKHLFLGTPQQNMDDMIAKGRARHDKRTPEERAKISAALLGKHSGRKGIPHTEETKKKISINTSKAQTGKKRGPYKKRILNDL